MNTAWRIALEIICVVIAIFVIIFGWTGTTINSGKGLLWVVFLGLWLAVMAAVAALREPRT